MFAILTHLDLILDRSDYPLLRLQHRFQVFNYLALEVLGFLFLKRQELSHLRLKPAVGISGRSSEVRTLILTRAENQQLYCEEEPTVAFGFHQGNSAPMLFIITCSVLTLMWIKAKEWSACLKPTILSSQWSCLCYWKNHKCSRQIYIRTLTKRATLILLWCKLVVRH